MIIGIAPGKQELKTMIPFTGSSGNLLSNMLEACGWHRDKTYCTNLLCYENPEPSFEEIRECWPRLLSEVELVKPKLVITLGKIASELFFPTREFGLIRGMIDYYAPWNCHVLPTYHPAACLYAKAKGAASGIASDITFDLQKIPMFFSDLAAGITDRASRVEYELVRTVEQGQAILDALPLDQIISLDIETTGRDQDLVDAHTDKLLCVGIQTVDPALTVENIVYVFTPEIARQCKWPQNRQWAGHYMTSDVQGMMSNIGVDLPIAHDSLILHYMLDERAGRFARHGLKPVSRQYAYAGFYEDAVASARKKNKMGDVSRAITHSYNADDVANTGFLCKRFIPMVRAEGMWEVYERTIKFSNVAKYMQWRGLHVSRERLADLGAEWIPLMLAKEDSLNAKIKELGGHVENIGSRDQMAEFLFGTLRLPCNERTKTGKPKLDKDVLELLQDEHPFVADLVDLNHLKHLFSTYILGVKDDIKKDGRVHPNPILHGTVSGRLAYSDPPINTIPRPHSESLYGPKLRCLFTATDSDHVILEFDYKQAELWMAAAYSGDPQLWDDLRSGDIHRRNAAFINSLLESEVTSAQRYEAKRTTFGKIYFIGDPKLAKQIKKPIHEAHVFSKKWDQRYAVYVAFADSLFRSTRESGEVRTRTGRVRRFPLILDGSVRNQIINFPIQASSHDYIMESANANYDCLRDRFGAYMLLDLHDAHLIEARKDNWRDVARHHQEVMQRQFFPDLPAMPVEVKIGPSWGEVEEVDL